jgi:exopolysaccharide biosynthesis protein
MMLVAAVFVFAFAFIGASNYRPIRNLLNVKKIEITIGPGVEIRPAMAHADGEDFEDIVRRYHPYAAINGTYYDDNNVPIGDILIDGRIVNRGCCRNAFAITKTGRMAFIHRSHGRLHWKGYRYGIAAGPRLVHNGKIVLDPVADGFTRKARGLKAWRSGIGETRSGKLLLITARESLTLHEFAQLMLDEGAVEAMNLDGGGACALYANGKMLCSPSKIMTNVLLVYKN